MLWGAEFRGRRCTVRWRAQAHGEVSAALAPSRSVRRGTSGALASLGQSLQRQSVKELPKSSHRRPFNTTTTPSTMGAAGSIPADEAAAKEAGRTDEEIAIYKFTQGYKDGSAIEQCTEDAELAYPGAPPAPAALMMSITSKFGAAFPDWTSKCLSITKNDDGTYTTNEQQCCGVMKADMPVIEGFPFPEVKVEELPEEAKTAEMTAAFEQRVSAMSEQRAAMDTRNDTLSRRADAVREELQAKRATAEAQVQAWGATTTAMSITSIILRLGLLTWPKPC